MPHLKIWAKETGVVSYESVNWQDSFGAGLKAAQRHSAQERAADLYDLSIAMRVVRRMETSATRGSVFAEIKAKNPVFRLVDWIYSKAGARTFKPLFLMAYMIKCILWLGSRKNDKAIAVAVANFGNERHSVERLTALVPQAGILNLSFNIKHIVWRGQAKALFNLMKAAPRMWPILSRLARVYSFMPAARIASALAYYIRFSEFFASRPQLSAAIIASNYSPEALGLAAAAHRMGRRVVYINHAPVPTNGAMVPPVLADCAVFYGRSIQRTYESLSRCTAEVALIGQPGRARPLEWQASLRRVGIFLTALTCPKSVAELVASIRASHPDVHILIRNHPVALLKGDFSDIEANYENLEVTIGTPLDDEIAACDLIFCGNSGVAMNILRGGRPVAYVDTLDKLRFDYNGFVEAGLVCHIDGWSEGVYARLMAFYASPEWRLVMQGYDASYCADAEQLEQAAADMIRRYLRPTPGQGSRAFPAQSLLKQFSRA